MLPEGGASNGAVRRFRSLRKHGLAIVTLRGLDAAVYKQARPIITAVNIARRIEPVLPKPEGLNLGAKLFALPARR